MQLRVCVLQSSYDDSASKFKEIDDFICSPAYFFKDPNYHFTSVKIKKSRSFGQIENLVRSGRYDIFLNLCDGASDEDRAGIEVVQALEELDVPFTGADSRHYDPSKVEMKIMIEGEGIDFPAFAVVQKGEDLVRVISNLHFPMIVKHPGGYGSIGLTKNSKCLNPGDLARECNIMIEEFGAALVEEFIEGVEVTVLACENGVNRGVYVYEPVQIHFPPHEDFKHFNLKWVDFEGMDCLQFAAEQRIINERCKDIGAKAFRAILGGVGYGRSDLRIDLKTGKIYFLEINPNCGLFYPENEFTSADCIIHGDPLGIEGFTKRIIGAAISRHQERSNLSHLNNRTGGGLLNGRF